MTKFGYIGRNVFMF